MNILVDTDAIIALIDINDSLHKKAKALLVKLHEQGAKLILLPTTLSEFTLIAANRIGLEQTKAVLEVWTKRADHEVLDIDQELTASVIKLYYKQTSKKESLFDCFIMAAAARHEYDAIFSFDKGYLKKINAGLKLKLVSELFPDINCSRL